jgi:hypothetical protein
LKSVIEASREDQDEGKKNCGKEYMCVAARGVTGRAGWERGVGHSPPFPILLRLVPYIHVIPAKKENYTK